MTGEIGGLITHLELGFICLISLLDSNVSFLTAVGVSFDRSGEKRRWTTKWGK